MPNFADQLAASAEETPVQPVKSSHEEALPAAEVSAPEEPGSESDAQPEPESKPAEKKHWLPAAIGGAVVLLLFLPGKEAAAPAVVCKPYTLEWYQQEVAPVKSPAHVAVVPGNSPTKAVCFDGFSNGVGWFYTFDCYETNGVPFTVTRITQTVFNAHGQDHMEHTGDEVTRIMRDPVLTKEQIFPFTWTGRFPLQKVSGVGLALKGVDVNENELIFRGYVELSQEIEE